MKQYILRNVKPDADGYQKLIDFYLEFKDLFWEDFELSFESWFSANLCAPLGAILDKIKVDKLSDVLLINMPQSIQHIFQRNEFLSYYGFPKILDDRQTVIKYLKLKPEDSKFFTQYIKEELIGHRGIPDLSERLKRKITESIYEMFVNAKMHSQTKFIYTCGQFFPQNKSIWFTITDVGVGFKAKINERFGSDLSSAQSIKWAVQNGKTTKTDVTGGIGLALLKEFITKNKGKMQIISGNGFYSFDSSQETTQDLDGDFPGTIISMEFKTDDTSSYSLISEVDINNIF